MPVLHYPRKHPVTQNRSAADGATEAIDYVKFEIKKGTKLHHIMRHTLGLFHGISGSSFWKRYLSENMCVRDADIQKVEHILDKVKYPHHQEASI